MLHSKKSLRKNTQIQAKNADFSGNLFFCWFPYFCMENLNFLAEFGPCFFECYLISRWFLWFATRCCWECWQHCFCKKIFYLVSFLSVGLKTHGCEGSPPEPTCFSRFQVQKASICSWFTVFHAFPVKKVSHAGKNASNGVSFTHWTVGRQFRAG